MYEVQPKWISIIHMAVYLLQAFDRAYIENPGPMVVFATPGMLHAGLSLQIFKKWAPFDQNMVSWIIVVLPGLKTCEHLVFWYSIYPYVCPVCLFSVIPSCLHSMCNT